MRRKRVNAVRCVRCALRRGKIVGRAQHTKLRRQHGGLVQTHCTQKLTRNKVAAGIAGHDNPEKILVIQLRVQKQARQAVEQRGDVRADGIVVIRAEKQHRVAVADCGQNRLGNRAAVEAAAVLRKMQARTVRTAAAVMDRAVLQ